MLVCDIPPVRLKVHQYNCFNPCFSGCWSATRGWWVNWAGCHCFNPCFSGCWSATVVKRGSELLQQCFNPCFSGCWSATTSKFNSQLQQLCFNPCFSGCWSATLPLEYLFQGHNVSILVLVDVGLRLEGCETFIGSLLCFNPCFSGCWSATGWRTLVYLQPSWVSILVLVDVGLRQYKRWYHRCRELSVSILVLVDVGLRHYRWTITEREVIEPPAKST